ncbi:MAG: hypothetical protein R3Y59_08850 [bacterium]
MENKVEEILNKESLGFIKYADTPSNNGRWVWNADLGEWIWVLR